MIFIHKFLVSSYAETEISISTNNTPICCWQKSAETKTV